MTSTESTSSIEPWMRSVASVLPLQHRETLPFTLGEAVDELRLWAKDARKDSWSARKNRESLELDIVQLSTVIGPRLSSIVGSHADRLLAAAKRSDIHSAAQEFNSMWRHRDAVRAAFGDLCDAASRAESTSWELRGLSDVLCSQLGPSALGPWGALRESATALVGQPFETLLDNSPEDGASVTEPSSVDRVRRAEQLLTADPLSGNVIVWLIYERAIVPWRIEAGPITFLWANWMVPNALQEDGQDFPERNELQAILKDALWAGDLEEAINDPGNKIALARVDLGRRTVAGALEEAERRVEAVLSIAVGAGGVSWQKTGTSSIVMDGRVGHTSFGLHLGRSSNFEDTYGMAATSEILKSVARRINLAMTEKPMPEYLVEALVALREASMTNHRDVDSYGTRAVTPRVATALEDHVMELISSIASMSPTDLAVVIEEREVEWRFQQRILKGIMSPFEREFNSIGNSNTSERLDTLEKQISHYDKGGRVISIKKAIELRGDLLDLPMTNLARADLEASLTAATEPKYETRMFDDIRTEVGRVRARHRRVRNAINHGNPVTQFALQSIRGFSERSARSAVNLALEAYATGIPISSMLNEERDRRQKQQNERIAGRSYLERHPMTP